MCKQRKGCFTRSRNGNFSTLISLTNSLNSSENSTRCIEMLACSTLNSSDTENRCKINNAHLNSQRIKNRSKIRKASQILPNSILGLGSESYSKTREASPDNLLRSYRKSPQNFKKLNTEVKSSMGYENDKRNKLINIKAKLSYNGKSTFNNDYGEQMKLKSLIRQNAAKEEKLDIIVNEINPSSCFTSK